MVKPALKPCGSWKKAQNAVPGHRHLCGRLAGHEGDHECWECLKLWERKKPKG